MDQFMGDMSSMGGPGDLPKFVDPDSSEIATQKAALEPGAFKEKVRINKGASTGLADKTSKLSSQERLFGQAKLAGKSAVIALTAINIALFTPIEFSFGKMTAMSLNAMVFCLDTIKSEEQRKKAFKDTKMAKRSALKRMEGAAKQLGALVGFTAMAVLSGGLGSIAMGSAFTIQNSLDLQEE